MTVICVVESVKQFPKIIILMVIAEGHRHQFDVATESAFAG
jgi:hypothetical protein